MKKTLLALALAAGLTSFAGSAKAGLTYNWSFNNEYTYGSGWGQASSGTITGTVGQGGAFTPISATYSSGDNTGSFDFLNNVSYQDNSLLASNDGTLTGGTQYLFNDNSAFQLNYYSMMGGFRSFVDKGVESFAVSYSPAIIVAQADTAAVPEPSQVAASLLLVAGIAGFVIVRRRKETALALAA